MNLQLMDSIFDQKFMVTKRHRIRMAQTQQPPSQQQQAQQQGCEARPIHPWHFEQYQDEAVFIPAGCPHQV
eukprot:scaffold128438_cov19-Tisochrysis_lutea.AAC.1